MQSNTPYIEKNIEKVLFEIELLISSRRILLETNFEHKLLNCVIPALLAGKYGDDMLSKCQYRLSVSYVLSFKMTSQTIQGR